MRPDVGVTFSRMVESDGGEGLYDEEDGKRKEDVGTGSATTDAINAILMIHLDARRASSVSDAAGQ